SRPEPDPAIARMRLHPPFQRAYWRAFEDALNGPFINSTMDPVMDERYQALINNGVSSAASPNDAIIVDPSPYYSPKAWIAARRSYLQSQLTPLQSVLFEITSNGGNNFSVNNNLLALAGNAPIKIKEIKVNGKPYPTAWTSVTAWTINIPLIAGANALSLQGYDRLGNTVIGATDGITVTYTGADESPVSKLVINEIMYHPLDPAVNQDAEYV